MYIETTNDQLRYLYDEAIMVDHYEPPGIEFSENNVARVVEEVGHVLVESETYPEISMHEQQSGSDGQEDSE